jgi:4-hydroxythreonine-4-phosphate dehydrogenase
VALREVPDRLSTDGLVEVGGILARNVRRCFSGSDPLLAVCGLNPHCSDGGRFGDEEQRIIEPAVERLRAEGVDARGPLPADTVFERAGGAGYDAVLAMYHDQGMIPVKFRGLDTVVNVTLGLDFIRTSVGHGTAYDIAGTGRASEGSLLEAVRVAVRMVHAVADSDRGGDRTP